MFQAEVRKLLVIQDHPRVVAGGVAVGIFVGLGPLYGLKTILAIGLAWLLGYSKIAAIISVSLTDILTPVMPMIMRFEYDVGYLLMSHPHHLPVRLEMHHIYQHLENMLTWSAFTGVGLPLFLGALLVPLPVAMVVYFAMMGVLQDRKKEIDAND